MLKAGLSSVAVLILVMIAPCEASSPGDGVLETINISADEAYEDIEPGVLHFKGHFLMQTLDWTLESGQATVYGPVDRPDRVQLEGAPARFLIEHSSTEGQDIIEATAPEMEYLRSTDTLKLSGGALLKLNDEVIQSRVIEYNISTERYQAGGVDGVIIDVPPLD